MLLCNITNLLDKLTKVDTISFMGIYTIDTAAEYPGVRQFNEGEVTATDLYTEGFPPRTPLDRFKDRPVRSGPGKEAGHVIRGVLCFTPDEMWFYYIGTDIDQAIYQVNIAHNFRDANKTPAIEYFRGSPGQIVIPNYYAQRHGGLKILLTHRLDEYTGRIIPPSS